MRNIKAATSSGGGQLSDEALLELLIKVRQGELSPAEAERLLAGVTEPVADPFAGGQAEQASKRGDPAQERKGYQDSAPLGQVKEGLLIVDTFAAHLTIQCTDLGGDLFRAHYQQGFPGVWVEGNSVTARFN